MKRWIYKSEPDVFSMQDLAASANATTRWDGVRNYQARNHLRAAAPGDLVLIYHSNCKVPGFAGLARVVSTPYPDPAQFEPGHEYFDPKSERAAPRWWSVDVKAESVWPRVVAAKPLKADPVLAQLPLYRQSRLSVSPVPDELWPRLAEALGLSSHLFEDMVEFVEFAQRGTTELKTIPAKFTAEGLDMEKVAADMAAKLKGGKAGDFEERS